MATKMRAPARAVRAAFVLAALFAAPASTNRFRDNPEFAVDRVREAWTAPIGELEAIHTEETHRGFGTGFLVSPCYVLTARHVVYGDDYTPKPDVDYRMKFRAGTSATAPFAGNTTATLVTEGWGSDSADWALLQLNNCIGKRPEIGWLEISKTRFPITNGDRPVARAVALGYAGDKPRGVLDAGRGELTFWEPGRGARWFDGSLAPGESGGPVMLLESGTLNVYGMIVGESSVVHGAIYSSHKEGPPNRIYDIYEVLNSPRVKGLLDQDKAAWGLPNPNLPRLRMSHLPEPK